MEFSNILILTILIALVFEFTNGFHDAANVVSTVIATKVLRPISAIILAAILNMVGATQVSKVAETITSGLISAPSTSIYLVLTALIGAILWNVFTWFLAIPSSSSYALIGGLIGSAFAFIGKKSIFYHSLFTKVCIPMVISPVIGFFLALFFMRMIYLFFDEPKQAFHEKKFKKMQLFSSGFVALSHGFNDAQKTMAVITLALFSQKQISTLEIPFWVIITCAIVMALGTAIGGMRIVETVGFKITSLKPVQGFAAETTSSFLICLASILGFPLSSTHLIVGSIAGVGSAKTVKNTSWSLAKKMVLAWVLTLPGSFIFSYLVAKLFLTTQI
jgi:PiT family inorganic phosphate transporter